MALLKRLWIPLLIIVVAGAGAFTVSRLHGVFGSQVRPSYADTEIEQHKPYKPKQLVYQVWGEPGAVARISYFDVDGEPQLLEDESLPWSLSVPMSATTATVNIIAQGNGDSIGCRITVDDEVKAEKVAQGESAFTYCLLKAA